MKRGWRNLNFKWVFFEDEQKKSPLTSERSECVPAGSDRTAAALGSGRRTIVTGSEGNMGGRRSIDSEVDAFDWRVGKGLGSADRKAADFLNSAQPFFFFFLNLATSRCSGLQWQTKYFLCRNEYFFTRWNRSTEVNLCSPACQCFLAGRSLTSSWKQKVWFSTAGGCIYMTSFWIRTRKDMEKKCSRTQIWLDSFYFFSCICLFIHLLYLICFLSIYLMLFPQLYSKV